MRGITLAPRYGAKKLSLFHEKPPTPEGFCEETSQSGGGDALQNFCLDLLVVFELYAAGWCSSQGFPASSRYGSDYFSNPENIYLSFCV